MHGQAKLELRDIPMTDFFGHGVDTVMEQAPKRKEILLLSSEMRPQEGDSNHSFCPSHAHAYRDTSLLSYRSQQCGSFRNKQSAPTRGRTSFSVFIRPTSEKAMKFECALSHTFIYGIS